MERSVPKAAAAAPILPPFLTYLLDIFQSIQQCQDTDLIAPDFQPVHHIIQAAALITQHQGITHQDLLTDRSVSAVHNADLVVILRRDHCVLIGSGEFGTHKDHNCTVAGFMDLLKFLFKGITVDLAGVRQFRGLDQQLIETVRRDVIAVTITLIADGDLHGNHGYAKGSGFFQVKVRCGVCKYSYHFKTSCKRNHAHIYSSRTE